jgi:hypothetical protein
MIPRDFRRAVPLVLALLASACTESGRPIERTIPEETEPGVVRAPETRLRVTNHNWSLIVVYALVDARSVRLGQVETGRTLALALPASAHVSAEVELVADVFASGAEYRTGPLLIEPGALIELVVENELALSHVRVEGP